MTALLLIALLGAPPSVAETLARHPGLIDAATVVPELQVELRYAAADNFLGRAVYGDLDKCYLVADAARMLARAQEVLGRAHPDLRLRVYDCARPQWVQQLMWKVVAGTPKAAYVADPKKRSIHNYGCAVDITVATRAGVPLDMGTPHDFFGERARPDRELRLLEKGEITAEQLANRLLLREAMLRAGFHLLAHEWWHFDCAGQAETRRRYQPIP